jgi:hypothetical protein
MPRVERWLRRALTVMGGFIAGAGVLTVLLAVSPVVPRKRRTVVMLGIAGLLTSRDYDGDELSARLRFQVATFAT